MDKERKGTYLPNFIILIVMLFTFSFVNAQRKITTKPATTLVTKSMSDKISYFCLSGYGYGKAVFYEANKEYLSFSDIAQGKGIDVLRSLYKYPKYSENFIRKVYQTWGYNGLKEIGFNDAEIVKSKKIINKLKSE